MHRFDVKMYQLISRRVLMKYLDVHQAAEKWEMTERRITMLCRDGKIRNVKKEGKLWLIPEGTPRPFDGRTKEAKGSQSKQNGKKEKKMGKYFGTDGFRGKAGVVLTAEHAFISTRSVPQ